MGEKKKWFDPEKKPEPLIRLTASGGVLWVEAREFRQTIETLHTQGRLPDDAYKLWCGLCDMPPAARLSRNHKTVLAMLADRAVRNVLSDGLTETEKLALRDLEHLHAPPKIRAVAQGLLNVQERQQLVDAVQEIYRDERTRRWRTDADH
jgi:hypothetical protein